MKKFKTFIMHPATPAVLGVLNLLLANGNVWMYITGIALIVTSVIEYTDR